VSRATPGRAAFVEQTVLKPKEGHGWKESGERQSTEVRYPERREILFLETVELLSKRDECLK